MTCLLAWTAGSLASIAMLEGFEIDFTRPSDAQAKATWSYPDKIAVSGESLGWDGDPASLRDGWIQTRPIALGFSWRPTTAMHARVTVHPLPREFALANGQKSTPDVGNVFARYSPDLEHWSSWQILQRSEPQSAEEKKDPGRHYSGSVQVPHRDQEHYQELVREYARMDVPWRSDEEAAVKWILARDPEFFAKQLPFVGYVQFLYELPLHGGQRIRSIAIGISYGMGGMHAPPKDDTRDIPWRFKAQEVPAAPATQENPDVWRRR